MRKTNTLLCLLTTIVFSGCLKQAEQLNVPLSSSGKNNLSTANKKNVIVFLMDDVGYEVPTYTGGQSYETPNLDAAAANGITYSYCHSAPLCSPSRFMLLTGKYNMQNYTTWGVMDRSNRTIGNMFREAGYATCVTGKWQFDGGLASILAFGFDSSCVFDPYTTGTGGDEDIYYPRYKNPGIYSNGIKWPDAQTNNKYGPDIFLQYAINFIDSCHKINKPFFIYFSSALCHAPFSPTPDDAAFQKWDPKRSTGGKKWYPSMVKYMDKLFGKLQHHLDSMQLSDNTTIFALGDNGTPPAVTSLWNGKSVTGEKGRSTEGGTHVPFFVTGLGKGSDSSLIDFTDIMPTLADVCNISRPITYGVLDGYSFWPSGGKRPYVFCYFDANTGGPNTGLAASAWCQDKTYKTFYNNKFYNISTTPEVLTQKAHMTPLQTQVNQQQKAFINTKLAEKAE